jgi:hypothetical protein
MKLLTIEEFKPLTKVDEAFYDLTTISKMSIKEVAKMADGFIPADEIKAAVKARDAGGLAHLIVRKEYGTRVYNAARKEFLSVKR